MVAGVELLGNLYRIDLGKARVAKVDAGRKIKLDDLPNERAHPTAIREGALEFERRQSVLRKMAVMLDERLAMIAPGFRHDYAAPGRRCCAGAGSGRTTTSTRSPSSTIASTSRCGVIW